jgi:2-methylisocitrate lyase-like PEP mutase family enzyme
MQGIISPAAVKQNSSERMMNNRFQSDTVRAQQTEKAQQFRALHERNTTFIIPNPWDAGTARLLEHLGFEALATTSMGYAFSLGRRDNSLSRDETFENAAAIARATALPVSADLENGFGDAPDVVAETIRLAAETGIVGGSVEDASGNADNPIYDLEFAIERVQAAVEAARALPFPFTLTARAENYLHGRPNLRDTIARLQGFQDAGADVLYAPGLSTREDIASVVSSVDCPVNVLMGLRGVQLTRADLTEIGVRRISVGSALERTALASFLTAAQEMREHGTFTFAAQAANPAEISKIFGDY